MFGLSTAIRLPRTYDVELLRRDLEAVVQGRNAFLPHYGEYHDGGWSAIGLISLDGSEANLAGGAGDYLETAALELAPYLREVIRSVACRKQRVRLMALAPGSRIFEHYDREESLDAGIARLHVPIVTDPKVEFVLAKRRQFWKPGELWYGDFSFPHALWNKSAITRVHLVMDCEVNEFVRDLFPRDYLKWRTPRAVFRNAMLSEYFWRHRSR